MPPAASDMRVLYQDDVVALSSWSNLIVTDVRGVLRREQLAEIARAYRAAEKLYPRGLLALAVIPNGVPAGSSESRAEASRMMEAFAGSIRHISVVLEGSGVWAATMRTVLRGLAIVARTPYAMKVHDDVQSATRVLAPLVGELTGQKASERELLEGVRQLRGAAGAGGRGTRSAAG